MATSLCSLCNTELVDNLICCSGQCRKFFYYACAGFSRTFMDSYKKVSGLRWKCTNCIDESKGLRTILDELTKSVNEIRSMIDTYGLVKSAVTAVFEENMHETSPDINGHTVQPVEKDNQKKKSNVKGRQNRKKKGKQSSSKPSINNTVPCENQNNQRSEIPPFIFDGQESFPNDESIQTIISLEDSSNEHLNSTVIRCATESSSTIQSSTTQSFTKQNSNHFGIRIADRRTYLWLGGFHHTSTAQQVTKFVSKILSVDENDIICRSLKSSRRTYNDFHHISFRIGLRSKDTKDAFLPNKWPAGITCKPFNQNQKN